MALIPTVRERENILLPSLLVSDYGIKALGERWSLESGGIGVLAFKGTKPAQVNEKMSERTGK